MSRRSTRRGTAPAFPALSQGVQNGLRRLVTDNATTVAEMLNVQDTSSEVLCEKCAQVMKQQQLSAASFLARFFPTELLAEHAKVCGKSSKGSAATLADRIAAVWALNKKPLLDEDKKDKEEGEEDAAKPQKKEPKQGKDKEKIPKKAKATKAKK